MSHLARSLLQMLFGWWLSRKKRGLLLRLKAKSVQAYLRLLQGVRRSLMGAVIFLFVMQLMGIGFFLMIGIGLYLAPLEFQTKLWVLFAVGASCFLFPALGFLIFFSERLWYRASGAEKMVLETLNDSK